MAPRYGDFTFDSSSGFTGSVKRKAFKRGGYAEGGMRSERTEVAKASRDVQDNALAPAKQLNKSLKNLYNTRKQTGYDGSEGYSKGGPKKLTPGEDPRQMLLGDIQPVTQKEKLNAAAAKPLRGSANQKSSDDLFRPLEPDMIDLMKKKKGGKVVKMEGGGFFTDAFKNKYYEQIKPIVEKIKLANQPSTQMSIASESESSPAPQSNTVTGKTTSVSAPSSAQKTNGNYETSQATKQYETKYEVPNVPTLKNRGGKVGYAGGGLHKMRSDKGVTGEVPGVKMGRRSTKIPGMLAPMNAGPKIKNPTVTATSSPLSNIALKRGGKAKK